MVRMRTIYCIKCNKYRKFKNPKISYIFDKILVLSITCGKCGSNDQGIFKEEESTEILKILGLIKNMGKENACLEFRLKEIDETRNCLLEEIKNNELISKKHKKACTLFRMGSFRCCSWMQWLKWPHSQKFVTHIL